MLFAFVRQTARTPMNDRPREREEFLTGGKRLPCACNRQPRRMTERNRAPLPLARASAEHRRSESAAESGLLHFVQLLINHHTANHEQQNA
jgi:hypothetical protein